MDHYKFPVHKLVPPDVVPEGYTPCIIATCGSYNPITVAHVDMFEGAKNMFEEAAEADETNKRCFVGAFLSPVNDAYKKPGLAPFPDRLAIVEASLKKHPWLSVDPWEGLQPEYQRSYLVLHHMLTEATKFYGCKVDVYFLCGGDLFESFYKPGCWKLNLLQKIFDEFYLIVVRRTGSEDPIEMIKSRKELLTHESEPGVALDLTQYAHKVSTVSMLDGDVSSTMVRNLVKAGDAVDERLMLPKAVKVMMERKLYLE